MTKYRKSGLPGALLGVLMAAGCAAAPLDESAAMTSLYLPEAAELAGRWRLGGGGAPCEVTLLADQTNTDQFSPYRLHDPSDCLGRLGLAQVVGWRPAPDGLELARADGIGVAFFSREGAERFVRLSDGLSLSRLQG